MSALGIVLIVLAALLVVLFVGGYVANRRRYEAEDAALRAQIEEADRRLAQAHAEDKGWDREVMETAVREAVVRRRPGAQIERLDLVQVVDRPGTDADEAVFRAVTSEGDERLTLGRREGAWVERD